MHGTKGILRLLFRIEGAHRAGEEGMRMKKWYYRYFLTVLLPTIFARIFRKRPKNIAAFFERENVVVQAVRQVLDIKGTGFDFHNSSIVLIGHGGKPIIPFIISFFNPSMIHCFDTHNMLSEKELRSALKLFLSEHEFIAQMLELDTAMVKKTLVDAGYMPFDEILRRFRLKVLLPAADILHLRLADNSIDLVCSYHALEHMHPAVIMHLSWLLATGDLHFICRKKCGNSHNAIPHRISRRAGPQKGLRRQYQAPFFPRRIPVLHRTY